VDLLLAKGDTDAALALCQEQLKTAFCSPTITSP
jgi:hypothetical protein